MDLELERWTHLPPTWFLVMVLAAFTALTKTFDVWETTRISPYNFELIPTPAQPRQRNQDQE